MIDLDHEVNSSAAELSWEIKRRLPLAHKHLGQIHNDDTAKMFCFTWGIPEEALYYFGKEILSAPWEELRVYFKYIAMKCFWESKIDTYGRLIKTIEGCHFSPFVKEQSGFFDIHVFGNDPSYNPVLVLNINPGIIKFTEIHGKREIHPIAKFIWQECIYRIPMKADGSQSYFWSPVKAQDPIKIFKFVLNNYSDNNYKVSKEKIKDVFKEVYSHFELLPPTPRISNKRANRLTKIAALYNTLDPTRNPLTASEVIEDLRRKIEVDPHLDDEQRLRRDLQKLEELARSFEVIAIKKNCLFSFDMAVTV